MKRQLPPLNSLRLFEAAARLLSFKRAAEELLLTPSAVSHGIQTLENWLGASLFLRTTKGLMLSDAGKDFYPIVEQSLDLLSNGSARIMGGNEQSMLAVSVAPTFAARWLLPRLRRFRDLHPEIRVVIDTSQEQTELSEAGADLAIRLGRGNWEGIISELVLREELVPVCAPELANRLKDPSTIEDRLLIHIATTTADWDFWAKQTGYPTPDHAKGLQFDTLHMAFEAACQGLGVALGRKPLVNLELESGRLVEIWTKPIPSDTAYWLVSSKLSSGEENITAFRRWIMTEAEV